MSEALRLERLATEAKRRLVASLRASRTGKITLKLRIKKILSPIKNPSDWPKKNCTRAIYVNILCIQNSSIYGLEGPAIITRTLVQCAVYIHS